MAGPVIHPLPTNNGWKPAEAVSCKGCLYAGPYAVIGSIAFGKAPGVVDTLHLTVKDQQRGLTWDVPIRFAPPVIPLATAAFAEELPGSCAAVPAEMVPTPGCRPKVVAAGLRERSRSRPKTKAVLSGALVGSAGFGRLLRPRQPAAPPPKHLRDCPKYAPPPKWPSEPRSEHQGKRFCSPSRTKVVKLPSEPPPALIEPPPAVIVNEQPGGSRTLNKNRVARSFGGMPSGTTLVHAKIAVPKEKPKVVSLPGNFTALGSKRGPPVPGKARPEIF